jgi:ABC-2 type transport system ATP-binding protein
MPTDGAIISVRDLTKRFNDMTAVNSINFEVKQKEVFAFLGPNGAGKSTTIKMLITLLAPTAGDGIVDTFSIVRNPGEVRRIIGYVPQMISVDGTLTAAENLMLMAKLYDIPARDRNTRIDEVLEFIELSKQKNFLVRTFSGGMIRKLEIGQAILHRPKVLFLDEPTSGLDPIARRNIWKHLYDLRDKSGTTIFFSTHYMEEAEDVADRVAIMHLGNVAAIGSVAKLKAETKQPDATLEDAFIQFTGASLAESGNFRDTKKSREQEHKLS